MWSSIQHYLKPDTLEEAFSLSREEGHRLFGGGSYLVSERDPEICSLVSVTHLVETGIKEEKGTVRIGAATTLQDLLEAGDVGLGEDWLNAIRRSCPSKMVRNQRTLGGEIVRGRVDSELYAALFALNAKLTVQKEKREVVALRDWDRNGVVVGLEINRTAVALERYALLDSAPAFVLVAGVKIGETVEAVAGGRAKIIALLTYAADADDASLTDAVASVKGNYVDDHYGSVGYKETVLKVALKRIKERL